MKANINNVSNNKTQLFEPIKLATEIIVGMLTALYTILQISQFFNSKKDDPIPETKICFINTESVVEYAGIEYIQCHITANPNIAGYQVKVFPYIAFSHFNKMQYIPILDLYTQEQYSADNNGTCILLRENTTPEIQKYVQESINKNNEDVKIGCLVVIEYTVESILKKDTFELRNGQLIPADEDMVVSLINTIYNENTIKISVYNWPGEKEIIKEQIMDKYG